jgi:Tol biopolymer transport system component
MNRPGRLIVVVGAALAIAVAFGCGSASGVAARATVSPCGTANAPIWSPDGAQIAWFGYRWPRPPNKHAAGSWNTLRAVCVSDANGKNLHQVPNTVCSEHCSNPMSDPPGQLDWVGSSVILAGNDLGVYQISNGQKPKLVGHNGPEAYSVDAAGDRVATANLAFGCMSCHGPVTIRSVPSGAVVGTVGGTKLNNDQPSLSPDGTQVVFTRTSGKNAEAKPSIWTASADGSNLKRLERSGLNPLWSPAGNRIAYLTPSNSGRSAWRLVAPQGGASNLLLRNGPGTVFGWSPNGKWIAFPDGKGRLAIINVATRKVRTLLKLDLPYSASSAAWSPDSQQLLVLWKPPAHTKCPSGLWRVPISGAKPHLVHGC